MIVGTYDTGDFRYGPLPCRSGMQDGTSVGLDLGLRSHSASSLLSHPHPGPLPSWPLRGLFPKKPSSVPETISRCDPQVAVRSIWKVRSESANCLASAARLGIWLVSYCW